MSLSALEQQVCARIASQREALLNDLRLHVETPTGGRNTAALDQTRTLLTTRAERLSADTELIPGDPRPEWLYGSPGYGAPVETSGGPPEPPPTAVCRRDSLPGAPARHPILLAGHLDTVHDRRGPFQKLTIAPDGKTATGPGCVDMKGGLVITLAALECLEDCGVRLPWTLLLNSDEETGSYHSAAAITAEARRVASGNGIGIAVEPAAAGNDGTLVTERAGAGQFMVEVTGRAAHVGRDFSAGASAVNELARIITASAHLSDPAADTILNIGPLEGGTATNVVPDRARAWGNLRFPTHEHGEALVARLQSVLTSHRTPNTRAHLHVSLARPAKPLTPATERLAVLARSVSESLGRPLPFTKTAGVCDGNLMQAAGLPTLDTLGVRGGGLHTPDEWIDLSSLVDRCQLLAIFMMRAWQGPSSP